MLGLIYDTAFYLCAASGLLSLIWRLYHFFYLYVLVRFLPSPNFLAHGKWAVITGSTDGLGLGYAKYFAKKGMNIALVGRNYQKLENVAQIIENQFHVETTKIVADFTEGYSIRDHLKDSLCNLDIGVLVNNVGVSYPFLLPYDQLLKYDQTLCQNMIIVNDVSLMMMTDVVLPRMLENNRGIILNISSHAGTAVPTPFLALYSASKAFISFFSQALSEEYSSSGVIIQNVCPSLVSTSMTRMKPSLFTPSVETFVRSQARTIGRADSVEGYWAHSLYSLFLPNFLKYWILILFSKIIRKTAERRIKKKAKQA